MNKCRDCDFYVTSGYIEGVGTCHKRAPRVFSQDLDHGFGNIMRHASTKWPETEDESGCGDWKPKE